MCFVGLLGYLLYSQLYHYLLAPCHLENVMTKYHYNCLILSFDLDLQPQSRLGQHKPQYHK